MLANWIVDNEGGFICNGGKFADFAYAYQEEPYVVFDLPRSNEDFAPYKAIECCKNGILFSSKYHSCMKRFRPSKVIVMANFLPSYDKLSMDRWEVYELTNSHRGIDITLVSIPCENLDFSDNFVIDM